MTAEDVGPLPAPGPSYIVLPIGFPSTTIALVTSSILATSKLLGIKHG